MKKVLLLVNTGTPDDPGTGAVRRYLSEFLNDPHVIDLPWFIRKILVNFIIVPFRAPHSAGLYRKLWTEKGSPLRIYLDSLVSKLQEKVNDEYIVIGAMRYGNPSLRSALKKISLASVNKITVLPLFPQYASSTTGSIRDFILNEINSWKQQPAINFVNEFYSHEAFIEAFAARIKQHNPEQFEHLLFSYHSLPVKHIQKVHPEHSYSGCNCSNEFPGYGRYCYRATCYETTRLIAKKLNLPADTYSTSFQSRFSKKWLTPFTDKILQELLMKGKKKILIAAPSFVADCLETIIEIDSGYTSRFIQSGGMKLELVGSLNDSDKWVDAIIQIAEL